MTPELTILTLAALWQVVHFAIYSVTAQRQVGSKYAASPRDTPRSLTGIAGRAQRAMTNHFEGLILFAIATLNLTYADKTGSTTAMLAALYLGARLLYLPAYLLGWTPWRSLIWALGFGATVTLLILALI